MRRLGILQVQSNADSDRAIYRRFRNSANWGLRQSFSGFAFPAHLTHSRNWHVPCSPKPVSAH